MVLHMLTSCVPTWYAYLSKSLYGDILKDMHEMAVMLKQKKNKSGHRYHVTLDSKLCR